MEAKRTLPANNAAMAQWNRLLDALRATGEHVFAWPLAQSAISQGQAVRHMERMLRGMFATAIELDDPDYPTLVRLFDSEE